MAISWPWSAAVRGPPAFAASVRRGVLLLLLAAFSLAQLQATAHAISHLARARAPSQRASLPHSVTCLECPAFAQAGAAPVAAPPAPLPTTPRGVERAALTLAVASAAPVAAYRSRAPPTTPY